MNVIATVEDLLEVAAGLTKYSESKITLDKSDVTIMHSIARQVFKGTPLTDRQFELVQEKLKTYKDQFNDNCNFDEVVTNLRMPLRQIDRSKYIRIVDSATVFKDKVYESYKENWNWIEVRFPFSKKLIVKIDKLVTNSSQGYEHKKGSHQHFFVLNEKNAFNIISELFESNFEIDEDLLSYYEVLKNMEKNKNDYIPGVYNFKLKNLNDKAIDYMISSIGEVSKETLSQYYDRREIYGLHHFDDTDLNNSLFELNPLAQKIASRKSLQVFVSSKKYNFNQVVESLIELDRFPVLVMIPDRNHLDYLAQVHQAFKNIINQDDSSVLFRLENSDSEGASFNDYVRNNKLNNSLDKNTKIVYTLNNKLPKPLIKSDWRPLAILVLDSTRTGQQMTMYTEMCDLTIHYDEEMSQFLRFKRHGIQEL